ncbi:MAG TPA: DNA-3-methyladenine glycosylase I [Candidatus Paceibacterota bacterium]
MIKRCTWPGTDPDMLDYHDREWGIPCHDDVRLFEYVLLDTFQAGLSWRIILHKRAGFRKAFANFNPKRIAKFTSRDVGRLMKDTDIIRNKQKILATISNARAFLKTQIEFKSFDKYIWNFVNGKPIVNKWKNNSQLRSSSPESDKMSKNLKKCGFKFVGPTICHAFMQASGLINDHLITCFRYNQPKK